MNITICPFKRDDISEAITVWNEVVADGEAFPQMDFLDEETGLTFFNAQDFTGVARDENGILVGLYILHPNNIGRCGHLCNASYCLTKKARGRHLGETLVKHSLTTAKTLGYRIMQFNAVVRTNTAALALYKKLGFKQLGVIPGGFLMKDGHYEDIVPHYLEL